MTHPDTKHMLELVEQTGCSARVFVDKAHGIEKSATSEDIALTANTSD